LRHFCATPVFTSQPDGLAEAAGHGLVQRLEEMPVGAEGHLDRGVPEAFHDRPRVCALGDEQGGVGVTEVVVAQPLGEPGPSKRRVMASGSSASRSAWTTRWQEEATKEV
jgi:hypothetical protein